MGLGGPWVGYLCLFAWWVCFYSAFAYVGFCCGFMVFARCCF